MVNVRTCLPLVAVASLLIGGCTIPSVSINVQEGGTPAGLATVAQAPEATTPGSETTPAEAPGEPAPTNTLVVPPASQESPPPIGAPPEQPTASAPIVTAVVDPELAALWNYGLALREEVAEPLEEMVTTLDDLAVGSGAGDIAAICTGVEVVLSTLAEVQQGLDQVGPPPADDEDLQLAYSELNLALDDLGEGFALLQSVCQTMNLGALGVAAVYLENGAVHMENAGEAMERWEDKVGL